MALMASPWNHDRHENEAQEENEVDHAVICPTDKAPGSCVYDVAQDSGFSLSWRCIFHSVLHANTNVARAFVNYACIKSVLKRYYFEHRQLF